MIRRMVSKLTYANVMATIAVFLALGAGSFSVASHLKVRSGDIVKNAVRSKHIKQKQVRAGKLAPIATRGRSVQVGPGETANVRVRCRQGQRVLSGGAGWGLGADHSALRLVEVGRFANGWAATGANEHGTESFPLSVAAFCLRGG